MLRDVHDKIHDGCFVRENNFFKWIFHNNNEVLMNGYSTDTNEHSSNKYQKKILIQMSEYKFSQHSSTLSKSPQAFTCNFTDFSGKLFFILVWFVELEIWWSVGTFKYIISADFGNFPH